VRSTLLATALFFLVSTPALALDKQSSAHGGSLEGPSSGVALSGSLMLGTSLYNPSYAARPDNTGIALLRYAAHADLDLIGSRLSVPLDLNFFTDYRSDGVGKLAPSEFDLITGLTTTWGLPKGAIEGGARIEHDRPVGRDSSAQTYADVRARYLYSVAQYAPGLKSALANGDISGWATFGWFAYNPSYFARPDNTGRALFRYAVHSEISAFDQLIAVGLDATFFTDRYGDNVMKPTELDITPEIVVHIADFDIHLAYETDMPLGRDGLLQRFVYLLGSWSFDAIELAHKKPKERFF